MKMNYVDNIWAAFIAEQRKRHSVKNKKWEWAPRAPAKEKKVKRLLKIYRKALILSDRQEYLSARRCGVFYKDGKAHPYLVGKGWKTI
jgi:hypothetical protein